MRVAANNPNANDCPKMLISAASYIDELEKMLAINKAAPDMYDALEQACTSMQDSGYSNRHVAVMAARLALAKARGEE
jgi:hypothetical protein